VAKTGVNLCASPGNNDEVMVVKLAARTLQMLVDLLVLAVAYALAFVFRFEFSFSLPMLKLLFFTLPYVVLLQYVALAIAGVPARAWRYIGLQDLSRVLLGIGGSVVLLVAIRLGLAEYSGHVQFVRIPLGVLAMDCVLGFVGIAGVRVLRRILAERGERRKVLSARKPKRTLLVGAGRAGSMVASEVLRRPDVPMEFVGFVDDDPSKTGTIIQGIKVVGDTHSLAALVKHLDVELVIITMASVSPEVVRRVVRSCEDVGVPTQIIPGMYEILNGRVNLSRIRKVTIDDLLGRDTVELDEEALSSFLQGRRVLVTGAGGSIGSELCRQLARLEPERVILLEQAEGALFQVHSELKRTWPGLVTVPAICDVCDEQRLMAIFAEHRPDVVFHAAAHKHVPMMEWNPGEAIKNNVFGTKNVADAAHASGTSAFVLISTDKAVNPTSIMGATKRAAELYVQALAQTSETTFVAVRFGNVLGSAGSVIPTFQEQIRAGGPVTVTHPDMERYFMTIPEASRLVMQAAAMGQGGELFVLDMGEPVNITQLARDLIRLSGLSESDIPIEFTGVRPGEKLCEVLSSSAENLARTRHPKIFIGAIEPVPMADVAAGLRRLNAVGQSPSVADARVALMCMVPEMETPAAAGVASSEAPARSQTLH